MKILINQFLNKQFHSWAVVGRQTARALINLNHTVDLYSTDGGNNVPNDLKPNLIGYNEENSPNVIGLYPNKNYSMVFAYTALKNAQSRLSFAPKNKFLMWAWEWTGKNSLPTGFAKCHKYADTILAPSNFVKQSFILSGIPEDKIKVISHGINLSEFKAAKKIKLPTEKKFKILANIAQNHLRKNIPGILAAYGEAFSNKDDVCLLLKAKEKPITQKFEVSLYQCVNDFKKKYPNHAEFKIYSEYLDNIADLYYSVDAVYTLSHCEGFYLPGIEAAAANKISILPNYGGQLDFANNINSLLISGKEERANPNSLYWEMKPNAIWFNPKINDAAEKLRYTYQNYEQLNKNIEDQHKNNPQLIKQYDWGNIAKQIIDICV